MIAIMFDMDDTLYDLMMPFEAACRRMFGDKCIPVMEPLFLAHRMHSDEVFEASRTGAITMEEMYIYRIQRAMEDFGFSISSEEALTFQSVYADEQNRIRMSETMRSILEFLKENNVRTGIITNGPTEHQWKKIRTLGADKYITRQHAIISGEAGAAKPDIRIFEHAEKMMGLQKQDAWYVGDSFENDIAGAKLAGWHAVWFNHRGRLQPENGVTPDYIVESEKELAIVIRSFLQPLP